MRDFNRVIRYLAYVLELLVLFMLQETPGLLPAVFGARPILVLPAALSIAMFEEELPSMAFGILGGLLCDYGLSCAMGFHGLIFGVLCFFVSILSQVYLQINLATAIITGLWTVGLTVCAQWLFLYVFFYSRPDYAFVHHYLPKYFYTLLFLPLLFLLNRGLSHAVRAS